VRSSGTTLTGTVTRTHRHHEAHHGVGQRPDPHGISIGLGFNCRQLGQVRLASPAMPRRLRRRMRRPVARCPCDTGGNASSALRHRCSAPASRSGSRMRSRRTRRSASQRDTTMPGGVTASRASARPTSHRLLACHVPAARATRPHYGPGSRRCSILPPSITSAYGGVAGTRFRGVI